MVAAVCVSAFLYSAVVIFFGGGGGEVGTKAKSLVLFRRPRRIGNGVVTGFNRTSAKASFKAFPWGLLSR